MSYYLKVSCQVNMKDDPSTAGVLKGSPTSSVRCEQQRELLLKTQQNIPRCSVEGVPQSPSHV